MNLALAHPLATATLTLAPTSSASQPALAANFSATSPSAPRTVPSGSRFVRAIQALRRG